LICCALPAAALLLAASLGGPRKAVGSRQGGDGGDDTQLGALGGILQAQWKPDDLSGIVPDDMPPGSALLFELFHAWSGEYRVRLRFAAMTLAQFRAGKPMAGGVETTPVTFTGCESLGCTAPIEQFESLAQSLEDRGFVTIHGPLLHF
jgi:hypothetical protein